MWAVFDRVIRFLMAVSCERSGVFAMLVIVMGVLLWRFYGGSLEVVAAMEDRAQVFCISPFLEEGGKAFMEKRPAVYIDE